MLDDGAKKATPDMFPEDVRHLRAERSEQIREETKQRKADKRQTDANQKSLMAQSYIAIAGLMNRLLDHGLLIGPNAIAMPTDIDVSDVSD